MTPSPAVLAKLHRSLEDSVGSANVRDDAGTLVTYATDSTPLQCGLPDLVVFPRSTEEVAAVLRAANEVRVPVIPRGSGTNLSGGTIAHLGGIVLVLTRMNRLLEIDEADLVGVCQPGVRTIELADAAAAKGLLFPPDPGSHTTATLGGNVAECSGGLRALKYGVTRDYVLGVEAGARDGRGDPQRGASGQGCRRL